MCAQEQWYQVHGTATDAQGKELADARVIVWRQLIRKRRRLVTGKTNKEGYYRLRFRPHEAAPGRMLLVVEVRSTQIDAPLESALMPAQPDLQIDLEAQPRDRSEFTTLLATIKPLLGNLSLLDIVESEDHHDISFLARESGKSAEQIMQFVIAARLEAGFNIPAAGFYAFIRQLTPSSLPSSLIEASQNFTLIDALVRRIGSLIFALTPDIQSRTLETAVKQNLIGPQLAARIPHLVNQLQAQRTRDVLSQPYLAGKTTLHQLLGVARLPKSKQDAFAKALIGNTQTMRDFWSTLADGKHGFTIAEVSAVRQTLELGAIVRNHLPLLKPLLQRFRDGTYKSLADLARLNLQDWVHLVNEVGAPRNIDGTSTASPAEVFAREIYYRVTRAYPTAALAARVATAEFIPPAERAPLNQFFLSNPTLELRTINLTPYLEQQGETALADISLEDRPAMLANVRRFQRVLRITPDADTAQTLLGLGIDSAAQIATMGRQQILSRATAAGLTTREANRAYEAGAQRYAGALSLFLQYNRQAIGPWPKAIGSISYLDQPIADAIQRDQSLATLFGSQDYCAVDPCTSILSPAAYLCDLLLWLRNHPLQGPFQNALECLFARRPDIGYLLLNCPNTNVQLPYVDLVNELLEDAISPPAAPLEWKQTTRSEAELRASPEHVNVGAHAKLAAADYPHTLPYDGPLDELRTVLQQSGVALWQLRQALLPVHNATLDQQVSVAAERFGLAPLDMNLITNANLGDPNEVWNIAPGDDPGSVLVRVSPLRDDPKRCAFLPAASITYDQLLELLDVKWVKGNINLTLQPPVDDLCDTSKQTLAPAPLDAGLLDRAHRFLRLWRHSGWKMWELDLLLTANLVGNNLLDKNALVALFNFRLLQDAIGRPVDQQLAFFQDLDTRSHRDPDGTTTTSLYARLFLDPAVPADAALAALQGPVPVVQPPKLSDHFPAIQAALQISASAASTLKDLTPDGLLTLANLSMMYRVITLARAFKLSLVDLQRVAPLTSAGSLQAAFATPAATLAFIRQVKDIQQSGLSIDALAYLLTPPPWTTTTGLTQDQITKTVLPAVRSAMQQTRDEIYGSADPPLIILQRELAQLPTFADPTVLATAISIVNDKYTDTPQNRNAFITSNFGVFMDPAVAQQDLASQPGGLSQAQIDNRANLVLVPLATYLTQTRVIATLAANLKLENVITALLVQQLKVPATMLTLLAVLTDPKLIEKDPGDKTGKNYKYSISPQSFPNQYLAIQLLDKAGIVVRSLHLVQADLKWLLDNAGAYDGLDFAQLPVLGTQQALMIALLLTTSLLVKLSRAFTAAPPPASIPDLYTLIARVVEGKISNETDAQGALATITGWPPDDIKSLASAIGLSFVGGDYTKPAIYDDLRILAAMLTATGASGAQLVSWGVAAPEEAAANSALEVLKSRFSNEGWLKFAPTLMDPMRERRSAALRTYLLAKREPGGDLLYGDSNALYEHFLIDVQMNSYALTTRVVQAYAAVQLFVERCLMGLEKDVVVDLEKDDTWTDWKWRKRYRLWEAARKVFLYPENWLIESQRLSRTEIFKKLEQEVHQNDSTLDYLETVALNYIDRLDEIAHLLVTGTCSDTGTIHVVARSPEDPPRFYYRSRDKEGSWAGWQQIPFSINSHQVVPAVYRGQVCLFWPEVHVANEPHQKLPPAQPSPAPPSQEVGKYVSIALFFSIFRNGAWAPPQKSKGKLFDKPVLDSRSASDSKTVEDLYTLKVQAAASGSGYGGTLYIDVFRPGVYKCEEEPVDVEGQTRYDGTVVGADTTTVIHLGRAIFDGRFSGLKLRDYIAVPDGTPEDENPNWHYYDPDPKFRIPVGLLYWAQLTYGPDAQSLLPLPDSESLPNLLGDSGLVPRAGALVTPAGVPTQGQLNFTSSTALGEKIGLLLDKAPVPFRVVGQAADLAIFPGSYFFYQDTRRCYFVESLRYYWTGSGWSPVPPVSPPSKGVQWEFRYRFHRFYHPYTRLFWHQLAGGGFPLLYDRKLQLDADTIDRSVPVFNFTNTYKPSGYIDLSQGKDGKEDGNKEIVDFSAEAAYSVYNWELFFHVPLYVAERLSQNQKFEDALKWFHFIFDPTLQGPDNVPQRWWIPKPLYNLTDEDILEQLINNLLQLVNQRDPQAVAQILEWQNHPYDPFLLADQRQVAYMKRVVMSYLDNLIAWADNLFSTEGREALNQATLLYVIAAEILGPQPVAITPPQHPDASFNDLERGYLDAFANEFVNIENILAADGSGGGGGNGGMPMPQTFYFKIPPNDKLLHYWKTVADQLFKLRHSQTKEGVTRQLALFDAPLDPGLLVKAQAAGIDIGSVLSDTQTPLPNYRFSALYPQALDFVNAVRDYGGQLLAALEQRDADSLALLLATTRQQLLKDTDQILEWKVEQAQNQIDALNQALALLQSRYDNYSHQPWANTAEAASLDLKGAAANSNRSASGARMTAAMFYFLPSFSTGIAGFGGSPTATYSLGGQSTGNAFDSLAEEQKADADASDKAAERAKTVGEFNQRADDAKQNAAEAGIEIDRISAELAGAQLALQIAQQNQTNHQERTDNLQQEIDFLTAKFANQDLYDWMSDQLATTHFQSYRLAYKLCQQVERCYRYELGIADTFFIQFGYWDSLKKGLLAGESLSHDLRRMQASYLEQNSRRFEISRFVSLKALDAAGLQSLLTKGECYFDLPEALFDGDYPGHYQRRLVRVSVTVIYPNPGKFDNVKGTLTLTKNSVRVSTDVANGYLRKTKGPDARFIDPYAAVQQKIVLSNAQDDPGLFLTSIDDNLSDLRYLPFEGAGAISSWHLELPAKNDQIDVTQVSDVIIHLYYTALDGGDAFKQNVQDAYEPV